VADRRLVVLRGPAGVGKSSLAQALREELGYPTAGATVAVTLTASDEQPPQTAVVTVSAGVARDLRGGHGCDSRGRS
jgi:cytidylate kinase